MQRLVRRNPRPWRRFRCQGATRWFLAARGQLRQQRRSCPSPSVPDNQQLAVLAGRWVPHGHEDLAGWVASRQVADGARYVRWRVGSVADRRQIAVLDEFGQVPQVFEASLSHHDPQSLLGKCRPQRRTRDLAVPVPEQLQPQTADVPRRNRLPASTGEPTRSRGKRGHIAGGRNCANAVAIDAGSTSITAATTAREMRVVIAWLGVVATAAHVSMNAPS